MCRVNISERVHSVGASTHHHFDCGHGHNQQALRAVITVFDRCLVLADFIQPLLQVPGAEVSDSLCLLFTKLTLLPSGMVRVGNFVVNDSDADAR